MGIATWQWVATIAALVVVLGLDFAVIGRRPHEPSIRESTLWVGFYVMLAGGFAAWLAVAFGSRFAGEFVAGWLTEYSLSLDNLFVFVLIMSRFAVPRERQQTVLLAGIALALVLRGLFIGGGAILVHRFAWIFYLFGVLLLCTAWKLLRQGTGEEDLREHLLIRAARRLLPHTAVVLVAIGTTDLIFALDSIPAIFGLTSEPYLVFTANVFALMGLRQLYFLLGHLLDRLAFMSVGLAVVLAFIGVKLVLEALHGNNVPFINGGRPVAWAPLVPIWLSLAVIAGVLALTAIASLARSRHHARDAGSADRPPATAETTTITTQ